ncbi:MAG: hypothetical protein U0271_29070 [Polyangiaceae bacterium]
MSAPPTPSLRRAAEALDRGADETALLALLEVWRAVRSARVADAIDAVSERTRASRPAIKGKTLAAQRKAWLEVAAAKDPLDVARLAVVPWPGKWQDAEAITAVWSTFPEDPRIATLFARVCCEAEYDSYRSLNFYQPVLHALAEWGDRRVIARLAGNDGGKREFYKKSTLLTQEATLAALRERAEPALSADDEAALGAIEARFVEKTREVATVESLWAEVLRRPDDRGAREVWADALLQRGDERGELVSLLLGEARGLAPKALRRLGALKKRLRRAHAGDLDELFEDEPRAYDDGLFAGGVLTGPEALAKLAARAGGHVLRAIDLDRVSRSTEPLDLSALPTLRTLTGVSPTAAARLAAGGPWPLVALGLSSPPSPEERPALDAATGLPALRLLGVSSDAAAWLVASPLCARLDAIWTYSLLDLAIFLTALDARPSFTGRVIARASLLHHAKLEAEARRGGEGWALEVSWMGPDEAPSDDVAEHLARLLGAVAPSALRRFAVRGVPEVPDERVVRALARHERLVEIALSFAPALEVATLRAGPRPAARPFDGGASCAQLHATVAGGRTDLVERALVVWDTLAPLELHVDSVQQQGFYGSCRWGELATAADPRALVAARAAEIAKEFSTLVLTREDASVLGCWVSANGDGATWRLPLPRDPSVLVAWLHDVCARLGSSRGEVRWGNGPQALERTRTELATHTTLACFTELLPGLGAFLGLVTEPFASRLTPTDQASLRAAGATLHWGPAGLILQLGEHPERPLSHDATLRLAGVLRAAGERAFERTWGYALEPLAAAVLAPAGTLRASRPDEARLLANGARYRVDGDAHTPLELRIATELHFTRALSLELHSPLTQPILAAYQIGWHDHPIMRPTKALGRFPIPDAASARAALEAIAGAYLP